MNQRLLRRAVTVACRNGLRPFGTLELVCAKCTRQGIFRAESKRLATFEAELKGWVMHDGKTVCPKCPAPRD